MSRRRKDQDRNGAVGRRTGRAALQALRSPGLGKLCYLRRGPWFSYSLVLRWFRIPSAPRAQPSVGVVAHLTALPLPPGLGRLGRHWCAKLDGLNFSTKLGRLVADGP